MKRLRFRLVLLSCPLILLASGTGTATAQTARLLQGCPFSNGDPVSKVQGFYGITFEPTKDTTPSTEYRYHFPEYGVWVFFNANRLVTTLRFERPFSGKIAGIGIGDSKEEVRRMRGEPLRQFEGFWDSEALEDRKRLKQSVLDRLPDPAPKRLVINALEEIAKIDSLPRPSNTAWTYGRDRSFVRYDIGARGNVQVILSNSCNPETKSTKEP